MTRRRLITILVPIAVLLASCGGSAAPKRPATGEWASLQSGDAAFTQTRQAAINAYGTPSLDGSWRIAQCGGFPFTGVGYRGHITVEWLLRPGYTEDPLGIIKRSWDAQRLDYEFEPHFGEPLRGELWWEGTWWLIRSGQGQQSDSPPGVSAFGATRFGVSERGTRVDYWSRTALRQGLSITLETRCFQGDGVPVDAVRWTG